MNFDEDVYDQLRAHHQGLPQLDPACRLASEQLEWLKPAVMDMTENGLYAGPVAHVDRGTILVVIANTKRVFTLHVVPPDGTDKKALIDGVVDGVATAIPELAGEPGALAVALTAMLKKYGGQPGKKTRAMEPELCMRLLGAVFSIFPPAQRMETVEWMNNCQAAEISPALIVLVGPASSGKADQYSMGVAQLPLAPYIDAVVTA